jgi:hypothetical protein
MADIDMYTYLLTAQQPPLPPAPKPKPAPPVPLPPSITRAQAREKARKEKEDLRAWWDDLPEEKRQEIRDTKIPSNPAKPKKEKHCCLKHKKPEEPKPEKKPEP